MNSIPSNTIYIQFHSQVGHLPIAAELLGAQMHFEHEGTKVAVLLPDADGATSYGPSPGAHHQDPGAVFAQRGMRPIQYDVQRVAVLVFPTECYALPLAGEKPSRQLDEELAAEIMRYDGPARRAFVRWAGVLRWKANLLWLARPVTDTGTTVRRGTAHARDTGQHLAGVSAVELHGGIVAPKPIGNALWDIAERELQQGAVCPLHVDLLADALEHVQEGRLAEAIVNAASACEIYMKMLVSQAMPPGVGGAVRMYVERANASTHRANFFPDLLPQGKDTPQWKLIASDLQALAQARNSLLHTGAQPPTSATCRQFIAAVEQVFHLP